MYAATMKDEGNAADGSFFSSLLEITAGNGGTEPVRELNR